MESVASSTRTTLGIDYTFPRVTFTHFFPSFIGWLVSPILMFSPTVLKIHSLLALKCLVSSWSISVQNGRSHLSARLCM